MFTLRTELTETKTIPLLEGCLLAGWLLALPNMRVHVLCV